jgi:hypothetical protein
MADSTTTGSALQGLNDGMSHGIGPSGTFCQLKPSITYCIYDPNNVVQHTGGSQIAWASATGSFFISQDVGAAVGGSTWKALKTV